MNRLYALKKKVRIESDELARKVKRLTASLSLLRGDAKIMLKTRLQEARSLREAFMKRHAELLFKPADKAEKILERDFIHMKRYNRLLST